jgi:hypothetical protein
MVHIKLLFFEGCPHVGAARDALRAALGRAGLPLQWDEELFTTAELHDSEKGQGSPTILINGVDVDPGSMGTGLHCRVYAGGQGAPSVDAIVQCLLTQKL